MDIQTDYWMKPIPSRQFDWAAWDADKSNGDPQPTGYGATEAEALADLQAWLEMEEDD